MADDDDIETLRRRLSMANRTLDDLTSTVDDLTDRLARIGDTVDTLEGDGDDADDESEQMARTVLTLSDVQTMTHEDRTAREQLAAQYGVDASAADDVADLQEQLAAARANGESPDGKNAEEKTASDRLADSGGEG